MSLIKSLQEFLKTYDNMEMRDINGLMTDTNLKDPSSYAIAPTGNGKVVTDIVGNRTYQNNYVFYAKESGADEVDRQENYDFLEDFSDWIEEQNDSGNFPSLPANYEVEELEVSNALLFDIEEDGVCTYQIQITMIFTKKKG